MALILRELSAVRVLPEDIAITARMIERAADHEEQIGKTIQILAVTAGNGSLATQIHNLAPGAPLDGGG